MMTQKKRWLGLFVFVAVCQAAGGLGAIATTPEIDGWFRSLAKPSWNPPDWVFGPVWTTLYLMMAVAGWMVWQREGDRRQIALTCFAAQLVLNLAWSWIFFHFHLLGWAAIEIVILWLAILVTTVLFYRIMKPAGWLMIPYLAWVAFAIALNFSIWRLNVA